MDLRYLIGGAALCMMVPTGYAVAQTDAVDDEAHSVTLVGCIMRESDFRDMYGPGQSGPRGPGIGLRNEYMLVDAHPVTPSGRVQSARLSFQAEGTSLDCSWLVSTL